MSEDNNFVIFKNEKMNLNEKVKTNTMYDFDDFKTYGKDIIYIRKDSDFNKLLERDDLKNKIISVGNCPDKKMVKKIPQGFKIICKEFNMNNSGITDIPIDVKIYCNKINFSNSGVNELKNWDFRANIIKFCSCGIKKINPNISYRAKTLDLSDNKIEDIPSFWNPMYRTINLSGNNIRIIPEDWNVETENLILQMNKINQTFFSWNPKCRNLNLSENFNIVIDKNWAPRCEHINLKSTNHLVDDKWRYRRRLIR